jgi:type II secretory ATPase GspE/PulE/Tfp pilus assembly ATPase PilB-like protein
LQELLGRALIGGIGRLYLERQEQGGRILWSQSGVLQSVLDHLSVALFKGVIDELKNLAELPLDPIQDTQQIELERLYQKHRILLRVRFMANRYGEEATLQVLRGAALKFYEKKQIDRLGKDALSIAQQLQRKLEQVRTHRPEEIELNPENRSSTETLSELSHVLNTLNETLKRLEE